MESTVPQKLDALIKIQTIDSKIDSIAKVRGALPDEVKDLEDELAGYQTRIDKYNEDQKDLEVEISDKKNAIKESLKMIEKYEGQQNNVRNNREFDALSKEIELQSLEIQISEKRIKEAEDKIVYKKEEIEETLGIKDERGKDLESKQKELSVLTSESEEEEKKLLKDRDKAVKQLEERLYLSYNKIRNNARNGLAVVSVKRGACGGCFAVVPPQRQVEIKDRKKLIVCENCGRILADVDVSSVVEETKPKRTTRKKTA
jgi:predicted  nucleic acid-binding Zn-ribbon protein